MIRDDAVSSTSAGRSTHRAVLLPEAIKALHIKPDGHYVDATFGRGGHSRAILAELSENGRLLALDRDPEAIASGQTIDDARFILAHRPFSELDEALSEAGWPAADFLDGVLLDIGVSSPQIDSQERGFSFRFNAPLDMRMDISRGETVGEWLARADQQEIAEVIHEYGEERFAHAIAAKIVDARNKGPVTNTHQLAEIIRSAVRTREPGQDAATRSFQALRIHINQELAQLTLVLPQALAALAPGGRLVVISFHSLEDRIVKRFFSTAAKPETKIPKNLPLRAAELPLPELSLCGKAIRPSQSEILANPRARSAIMRVGQKCGKTVAIQQRPTANPKPVSGGVQ